ncbi:MAG: FAD/NAD(P)-binding protein [Terriglobia bacterium]
MTTAIQTPDPMMPLPYVVTRMDRETYDTFTMQLKPDDGIQQSHFQPGQFNMLYVFGTGEVPISISGDPAAESLLTHTTREVGSVTQAMRKLKRGDWLGIRGPYGNGWPVEAAEGDDVLMVAGGIGLAPLRPALYHVLAHREKYGKVALLYGARTPDDILYRRELEKWRSQFDLNVLVTVDRALGNWRGNVGVVTTLIPRAPFEPSNTTAMVCGPEIMMRYVAMELQNHGVPTNNIHVSMERNMKCGVGFCGHCQYGPQFICKDGPVFSYLEIKEWLSKREI